MTKNFLKSGFKPQITLLNMGVDFKIFKHTEITYLRLAPLIKFHVQLAKKAFSQLYKQSVTRSFLRFIPTFAENSSFPTDPLRKCLFYRT